MFVFSMLMFLKHQEILGTYRVKKNGHKRTPVFTLNSYTPFSTFRFEVVIIQYLRTEKQRKFKAERFFFYNCDPPQDFNAKGESTRTTRFHFKTKEFILTRFSTLAILPH